MGLMNVCQWTIIHTYNDHDIHQGGSWMWNDSK